MLSKAEQFGLIINTLSAPCIFWVLSLLLLCFLLYRKNNKEALVFAIALFATVAAVEITKFIFAVPRPADALLTLNTYAFPSGHAASGMFLAVMITWLYAAIAKKASAARIAVIACTVFSLALCIGYSRILIGVHTPLQVLAGFAFGIIIPLCIILIFSKKF